MKKNVRKMVAVLLAVVLTLGALPVVAMAEEADTRAVPMCTHLYAFVHANTYYVPSSDTQHIFREMSVYMCSLCDAEFEEIYDIYEDHVWVKDGHVGTQFRSTCSSCGYSVVEDQWRT